MTFAVLATGESLTQAQVDSVRHLRVIAVSDAYRLAPWAEALVSADGAWWRHHDPVFPGRRFSAKGDIGTEHLDGLPSGLNSGVLGIRVARHLGAKRIILLGFDGHGSHFFGLHPEPLKNTSEAVRRIHAQQHMREASSCNYYGIQVINCTPGTALHQYPTETLENVLADHKKRAEAVAE